MRKRLNHTHTHTHTHTRLTGRAEVVTDEGSTDTGVVRLTGVVQVREMTVRHFGTILGLPARRLHVLGAVTDGFSLTVQWIDKHCS